MTTSAAITVRVTRTGGVAGMTRRWQAEAAGADADPWRTLIRECAWEDAASAPRGADGFTWSVEAVCDGERCAATLAENDLDEAWRTLIDEVRAAGR